MGKQGKIGVPNDLYTAYGAVAEKTGRTIASTAEFALRALIKAERVGVTFKVNRTKARRRRAA